MKISRDNNLIVRSGGGVYNNSTHWEVHWDLGITAAGSSGSPLFDQNHRIIGQLHGGTSYCSTPIAPDWYGSFDQSWTGGGTNSTRLSNWLDASNSGAITTNTTNVSNLINAKPALSISGNDPLCYSASYTLNGATTGTITWSSSNTSIATVTGQGSTATVTKVGDGSVFITATVTFCPGTTASVSKQITVGAATNYYIQSIYVYPDPPAIDVYTSGTGQQQIVTSWSIAVDGVVSRSDYGYPPTITTANGGTGCGSHTVTLTTYNSCGSFSTSSYFYRSGCYSYTIAPNPATNQVTITDPNNKLAKSTNKVIITILDQANRQLKQFNFSKSSQYNFSIAGLTSGTYIIQIKQNGIIENLKLIKQ